MPAIIAYRVTGRFLNAPTIGRGLAENIFPGRFKEVALIYVIMKRRQKPDNEKKCLRLKIERFCECSAKLTH